MNQFQVARDLFYLILKAYHTMTASEELLRNQLASQIRGGNAFIKIENILQNINFDQLGKQPYGLPYSLWQQFEHMRITQRDILDFSLRVNYHPLDWPVDYWPDQFGPSSLDQWEKSQKKFFFDREEFLALLLDPKNDLYKPLHQGETQTLFREALLILEHNAYHTGQLMIITRLLQERGERV